MSEKHEEQPKTPENEESKPFRFKDKYNEFQIPRGLKLLVDQKPDLGTLGSYLYVLVHVSSSQQAEYKHTENVHFTPQLKEGEDPIRISNVFEKLSKAYEGSEGMEKFIGVRKELLDLCGHEFVLELERYLGVDSQGIEAGDERPLLGVDMEIIKNLAHYIEKEAGYEEIDKKD